MNVIELTGVGFEYNGQEILRDVNLTIGQDDFVAVVGPNGGGKTTLLKLMLGLLTPTAGQGPPVLACRRRRPAGMVGLHAPILQP